MAFTCLYAASGKNACLASDGRPVLTASQRSVTMARKAGPCARGLTRVWASWPCPGATGSGPPRRAEGVVDGAVGVLAGRAETAVLAGDACWPAAPAVVPHAVISPAPMAVAHMPRATARCCRILIGRHRSRPVAAGGSHRRGGASQEPLRGGASQELLRSGPKTRRPGALRVPGRW